jgi:hypothetical protein
VSPKDFNEAVEADIWIVDQIDTQSRVDPEMGAELGPETDPELYLHQSIRNTD